MHDSVLNWVAGVVNNYDLASAENVLEVGSYDVNGSVKQYFHGTYTGVDFREGPGVDIVANAHALPFSDASFDVVVSTEMLEHDSMFWLSMEEMGRVLKPGGCLIITARGNGYERHDWPNDYYRYMPESINVLLDLADCETVEAQEDPHPMGKGIFGVGIKRDEEPLVFADEDWEQEWKWEREEMSR